MSITPRLSFFRNNALALLALSLIGCSGGDSGTAADPNVQYTDSYKVEYVPGAMDATEGKSQFKVVLTNLNAAKDLQNVALGPIVTVKPMMYMTDKTHSTAVANNGTCSQSITLDTYVCTVFYVMADNMNGVSMGHWELEVTIDGTETVKFFPSVGMAMGGTAMAKQFNSNFSTMMGLRTFQVFKSGLTYTGGNHTFDLFISTMETMDAIFPAVYPDGTLGANTIANMTVDVSTTANFAAPYTATSNNNGYWSANIPYLVNDVETQLYVRVVIDGNTLNSDGLDGIGGNNYATFTITPTTAIMGM